MQVPDLQPRAPSIERGSKARGKTVEQRRVRGGREDKEGSKDRETDRGEWKQEAERDRGGQRGRGVENRKVREDMELEACF